MVFEPLYLSKYFNPNMVKINEPFFQSRAETVLAQEDPFALTDTTIPAELHQQGGHLVGRGRRQPLGEIHVKSDGVAVRVSGADGRLCAEPVGHDAGRSENAISKALENAFVPRGAEAQVVGVDNQAQTGLALARHAAYTPS
jgi:hypothetical protein